MYEKMQRITRVAVVGVVLAIVLFGLVLPALFSAQSDAAVILGILLLGLLGWFGFSIVKHTLSYVRKDTNKEKKE